MNDIIRGQDGDTVRLNLAVWHPGCWTLEVTNDADAGLLARGVYTIDNAVHARLTAQGPSEAAVEQLVESIEESPRTDEVRELNPHLVFGPERPKGKATQELLVEYPDTNSIYEPFLEHGFLPDEQIRIRGGTEYWTVVARGDRDTLKRRLDEIRSTMDADIEVRSIATHGGADEVPSLSTLSHRQREALRLAIQQGYYEWPRESSATELAAKFGVNKATFLEHLRKAEAKLLGERTDDLRW